ncbi:MAG: hypothetical protein KC496_19870, partial [Anaerolineae bacterium]|nr:hypothetical protein [Anaerolineae bacterium]
AKIVLLAPFEGRYREVGYNALYAARLAFADSGAQNIDLYPVDDGESPESAAQRAAAFNYEPTVKLIIVLGIDAADETVQEALAPLPTIIVGHWNSVPSFSHVVMLADPTIDERVSSFSSLTDAAEAEAPLVGDELLALQQLPLLREDLNGITVLSSAILPDAAFRARYGQGDPFAPQPGLLATLTYDATRLAIEVIQNETPLTEMHYDGINGSIAFENGYWMNAPLYEYIYRDGDLVPASPQ